MGFFNKLVSTITTSRDVGGISNDDGRAMGIVNYGSQKTNGGHDHRYNKGKDRTPAQTTGDKKRRKK